MMLEEVDWLLDEESCSDSDTEKYDVINVLSEKRAPMVLVEAGNENPFVLPPREARSEESASVCSQLITARRQAQYAASKASAFNKSIASKNASIHHLKSELQRSSETLECSFMKSHDTFLQTTNQRGHFQLRKLTDLLTTDINELNYEIRSLQSIIDDNDNKQTVATEIHQRRDVISFAPDDQIGDDCDQPPPDDDDDDDQISLSDEIALCDQSAVVYTEQKDILKSLETEMMSTFSSKVLQPLQLQIMKLTTDNRQLEDQIAAARTSSKKKSTGKQLSLPVMGAPLKSSVLL
eukprot:TRINITY_DN21701_c0_g1_i1.p1 TRINITY_DN21701_c0_g1~~TRINITY_DN21701_c0_g1_i1.p1  ORF type:complete len:294 (+),score=73.63 TRINITY_DN21701_c0_g1_i1:141-1022(+)